MLTRRVTAVVVLAVAALGSTALLLRLREQPEETGAVPEIGIGYFVEGATLSATGTDGRIVYRVSAATVAQSPADGSVRLDTVTLDYEPSADVPWHLRADTGKLHAGGKIMELSGNVVAATRDAGSPVATISTDYLEFDPGTDIATTRSKVVIDYAGGVVHATGLRAWLREDRLELLADVRGRYSR